jgi:hypothetical protein
MTLWDRKFGLIIGLALFTFACEEPGEIGLNINPENGTFVSRFFEIPLENTIVQHEDIFSDNATRIDVSSQDPVSDGRFLVGKFSNPDFGTLEATAYSAFNLSKFGFKSAGFTYDSLVMHIRVDYLYGSNFLGNKRISVYELTEELKLDSLYLTKNSTPYSIDPVGEFNFDVSLFDTTFVDTVYTTRLSDELGMRFFDRAQTDTMTYQNNGEFRSFFNGLALVPDENNGMVASIHAESSSTFMRLHLHDAEDTTFFDFIVEGYIIDTIYVENDTLYKGVNITKYYNSIKLDKSGSPIAGIPGYYTDFETDNELTYIQGSAGVFTKLNFNKYHEFLDTVKNLVINRAELVVPVAPYNDYIDPSVSLSLYLTDENNGFVINETDSLKLRYQTYGRVTYSEFSNENRGEYTGDITSYIQELTSGAIDDTFLFLGQPGLENSVLTVNQTAIEKDKIFLRVYYSSLK